MEVTYRVVIVVGSSYYPPAFFKDQYQLDYLSDLDFDYDSYESAFESVKEVYNKPCHKKSHKFRIVEVLG